MSKYQSSSTSQGPPGRPAVPSGPTSSQSNSTDPTDSNGDHQRQQQHHHEDRLARTWRSLASAVVVVSQKEEKAVAEPTKNSLKELDECVVGFLRTRVEWGRLISYLEAKLEGKAKEMEILQQYVRSQPSLGRKRKREKDVKPEGIS
jgi:hypothetical protein